MSVAARLGTAVAVLAASVAGLVTITGASEGDGVVLGPGPVTVTFDIDYSRFTPEAITVRRGTAVTFVVRNGDPINHELIVGDDGVHARHADGTEASHPPVPGEVSVGPGETARTTYVFETPSAVLFACHLPGHFDYGMRGTVRVRT